MSRSNPENAQHIINEAIAVAAKVVVKEPVNFYVGNFFEHLKQLERLLKNPQDWTFELTNNLIKNFDIIESRFFLKMESGLQFPEIKINPTYEARYRAFKRVKEELVKLNNALEPSDPNDPIENELLSILNGEARKPKNKFKIAYGTTSSTLFRKFGHSSDEDPDNNHSITNETDKKTGKKDSSTCGSCIIL